jgi:hypothetical protein
MDIWEIQDEYEIKVWDLPDTETYYAGLGGERHERPKLTQENLEFIIEKHNEFVAYVAARLGED